MTPDEQIAAIRERHAAEKAQRQKFYDTPEQLSDTPNLSLRVHEADVLLARIDELTAERDRAEQMKAAMGVTLDFANHDRERLTAELAAANARADGERAKLLSLAEDLANGYDHEPDAHRYDNGACRKCKGQEILKDYAIEIDD